MQTLFNRCARSLISAVSAVVLLPSAAAAAPQEPAGDGVFVAARLAGEPITVDDMDGVWRREDPVAWLANMPHLYEARLAALRIVVAERFLAREAEAAGLSAEAHTDALIEEQISPPTADELEELVRHIIREQPGLPQEFRRDLAEMQHESYSRLSARSNVLDAAYSRAEASGALSIHFDHPRILGGVPDGPDLPSWGAPAGEAPVALHIFSDFTCPYCAAIAPRIDRLVEELGSDIRVVFRHFPASSRPGGRSGAEAAACAHRQGGFDTFHDTLFQNQDLVAQEAFAQAAEAAGLDPDGLARCISAGDSFQDVQGDLELGFTLGVRSTPTSFVNGRPLLGAVEYATLRAVVEEELARARAGR